MTCVVALVRDARRGGRVCLAVTNKIYHKHLAAGDAGQDRLFVLQLRPYSVGEDVSVCYQRGYHIFCSRIKTRAATRPSLARFVFQMWRGKKSARV